MSPVAVELSVRLSLCPPLVRAGVSAGLVAILAVQVPAASPRARRKNILLVHLICLL